MTTATDISRDITRKALARIEAMEAALEQCAEYFRERADVVDGDYGQPAPNEEMQLLNEIEEAIGFPPEPKINVAIGFPPKGGY